MGYKITRKKKKRKLTIALPIVRELKRTIEESIDYNMRRCFEKQYDRFFR